MNTVEWIAGFKEQADGGFEPIPNILVWAAVKKLEHTEYVSDEYTIIFGVDRPSGWDEFWCEETGHNLRQIFIRQDYIKAAFDETAHKLNSLRNQ